MSLVSRLDFPQPKTLAGWWRQMAGHDPQRIWFAHLFVHRVEAAVRCRVTRKLDPLPCLTLEALELEQRQGGEANLLSRLEARLHLSARAIIQILRNLSHQGLVEQEEKGGWTVTGAGVKAKEQRQFVGSEYARHVFPFLERVDQHGERVAAPHFLNMQSASVGAEWQVNGEHSFDVALLRECLARDQDWKRRHSFPLEIEQLVDDQVRCKMLPWQRVIVDRPERLAVVLVVTGEERVLGFAVQEDGWMLLGSAPLFSMDASLSDLIPAIAQAPGEQLWRSTWQEVCESRGITQDIQACELAVKGTTLHVYAREELAGQIRGQRDLTKDGVWLLAGDGLFRPMYRVKLVKPS